MNASIKKMRGIAVFDMEIVGDYSVVAKIESSLKDWAAQFIKDNDNPHSGISGLKVVSHQAAMTDRRGDKTGPVEKIVFRN